MRQKVGAAEDNLAGQEPSRRALSYYLNLVIRLLHSVTFGIGYGLVAVLQNGNLILRVNGAKQQRVIDVLRAQVFQRLGGRAHDLVVTHNETILGRDPQFELLAVANHIEGLVTDDGHQPDHAQHGGLSRQNVAANFLIVGDLAFFRPAHGGIDVYRGLHSLDLVCLGVDEVD